jgi:hypothetical protein
MASQQRQELFTLYAANIASGHPAASAFNFAVGQMEYFNSMAEPPQTEETGLWVARDKNGTYMAYNAKPIKGIVSWELGHGNQVYELEVWLAKSLVGSMEWTDEPRKVTTKPPHAG